MGACKWSGRTEKILEKLGLIDGYVRKPWEWRAMEKGRRLEPEARSSYEAWMGIQMTPANILHPEYSELRASCDGLNKDAGRVLEIKCPGKEAHAIAMSGKIPDYYFWQCVHLLMVSGMDWLDYYSFDEETRIGKAVCLKRDLKLEKRLMEMELEFWAEVQKYQVPSNVIPFRR